MPKIKFSFKKQSIETGIATPGEYLQYHGAKVPVIVELKQNYINDLTSSGETVPESIECYALIDTGASESCIDINLARQMQLQIIDETDISTPSQSSAKADVYTDAIIKFKGENNLIFESKRLLGVIIEDFEVGVLLGRDFLATCDFYYSGPKGEFIISTD